MLDFLNLCMKSKLVPPHHHNIFNRSTLMPFTPDKTLNYVIVLQRCCMEGVMPQFSLGFVDLKHGVNNLFPIIRPFPDWQSFMDSPSEKKPIGTSKNKTKETPTEQPAGTPTEESSSGLPTDKPTETASAESTKTMPDEPTTTASSDEPTNVTPDVPTETASGDITKTASDEPTNTTTDEPTKTASDEPTKTASDKPTKTIPNDPCKFEASTNETVTTQAPQVNATTEQQIPKIARAHRHERIINAVDAFLDEHGRLLWVLDTGVAGEDACYGNIPPSSNSQSANNSDTDELLPPKFVAIDVHENEVRINCIFQKYPIDVKCTEL